MYVYIYIYMYRGYVGIMEKKMEATIYGLGLSLQGSGFLG